MLSGFFRKAVFVFLFLLSGVTSAFALEIPPQPEGYVTDRAGLLSAELEKRLEGGLRILEKQTSVQLIVAIFKSLEGDALEDFSIRLAEAWKVGQKGKDNGVIFLIFQDDRKMRIEVGYGLEGALPDAKAGQIIQNRVIPLFKQEQYEAGVMAGISEIMGAVTSEFKPVKKHSMGYNPYERRNLSPEELARLNEQYQAFGLMVLFIVIAITIVDFFRYRNYRKEHRLYHNSYSFGEWWFRFAILLFLVSFIFRMLFYIMLFSRGGYYGGRSGFSGFRGGGGSFGGGGASGGW